MDYKELRKVLNQEQNIELFIFKRTKTGKKTAWEKIYKVKNTRKFDALEVKYLGSQKADINGEQMLVADLLEHGILGGK